MLLVRNPVRNQQESIPFWEQITLSVPAPLQGPAEYRQNGKDSRPSDHPEKDGADQKTTKGRDIPVGTTRHTLETAGGIRPRDR